jgi:hypothetical protein
MGTQFGGFEALAIANASRAELSGACQFIEEQLGRPGRHRRHDRRPAPRPDEFGGLGLHGLPLRPPGEADVGSNSGHGGSDFALAGTVGNNNGPVQPGYGQEVDLATNGVPGVVVDALVVGGAGWYNTYRNHVDLPPGRGSQQHYIPPLDGDHHVSWVSYWYTCYHVDPQPALPEVPSALEVPLAGGAIFAAFMFVQHRRRRGAASA